MFFVGLRHLFGRFPVERAFHELDARVDREGHLVETRRIEWVEEAARVAHAGPPRTDVTVDEIGEVSVRTDVLRDRLRVLEKLARQRVRVEEPLQLLERRAPFGCHETLVPHETDARLAAVQRDEPDPVAPAGEMVRRKPARRQDRTRVRVGGIGPGDFDAVQVFHAAIAHPDGGGRVGLDRRDAAASPREHGVPAGRVHEPLAAHGGS